MITKKAQVAWAVAITTIFLTAGTVRAPEAVRAAVTPNVAVMDGWGGIHPVQGATVNTTGAPYWLGWSIARGFALLPGATGGYTLDGFGGVWAFGNAPPVTGSPYWGWDIARGIALNSGSCGYSGGGYVLDGYGGIHPFGGAPGVTSTPGSYWPYEDVAKSIALFPQTSPCPVNCPCGYVMDIHGGVHDFARGAVRDPTGPYWPNWNIARAVAISPNNDGYVLDGLGGMQPVNGVPNVNPPPPYFGWDIARAVTFISGNQGYVLDGYGGPHEFGGAPPVTTDAYWPGWDIAVAIASG